MGKSLSSSERTKASLTLTFLSLQKSHFWRFIGLAFFLGGEPEGPELYCPASSILRANDDLREYLEHE